MTLSVVATLYFKLKYYVCNHYILLSSCGFYNIYCFIFNHLLLPGVFIIPKYILFYFVTVIQSFYLMYQ